MVIFLLLASVLLITLLKVDDKKDKIALDIDVINKEAEDGNKDLVIKIKKYSAALKKALRKGVINSIGVSDIPESERFGDLLYLQGSWKLKEEVKRLNLIMKNQVVDTSTQEEELKKLATITVGINDNVRGFVVKDINANQIIMTNPNGEEEVLGLSYLTKKIYNEKIEDKNDK